MNVISSRRVPDHRYVSAAAPVVRVKSIGIHQNAPRSQEILKFVYVFHKRRRENITRAGGRKQSPPADSIAWSRGIYEAPDRRRTINYLDVAEKSTCHLCGLPIIGETFRERDEGGEKLFCCHGCREVYKIAREIGLDLTDRSALREQIRSRWQSRGGSRGYTADIKVEGMYCPSCPLLIEAALLKMPGVTDAEVNYVNSSARVRYEPSLVGEHELAQVINSLGYRADISLEAPDDIGRSEQRYLFVRLIIVGFLSMDVMFIYLTVLYPAYVRGILTTEMLKYEYVAWALSTPVQFWGGWPFLRGAYHSLRARYATMDLLVSLGTLAAYFYSVYAMLARTGPVYFDSSTMIIMFLIIGRSVENLAKVKSANVVGGLISLLPKQAWIIRGTQIDAVAADGVGPGDLVLIRPGERVPVDGVVAGGSSSVDESMLTGESVPIDKETNATVLAGTLNLSGSLTVEATKTGGDVALTRIAELVEEAQSGKASVQRFADRIAAWFVPAVLACGVVAGVGWYIATGSFGLGLTRAVTVLVVACPCSLGLATPLAIRSAVAGAARRGVLVRNADALERSGLVNHLVFDKTGTITRAKLSVAAIHPTAAGVTPETLLRMAAAVELHSEHPLARAIGEAFGEGELPECVDFRKEAAGVRGVVDGVPVLAGSERYLALNGIAPDGLGGTADEARADGQTAVFVACQGRAIGVLLLSDQVREGAQAAIDELKATGLALSIISGDNRRTVEAIGRRLGIDTVFAEVWPDRKLELVKELQKEGFVGMVGDGINDAPALVQADLGIAMGGGTDIAADSADVTLLSQDLSAIADFMRLSRRTMSVIRENFAWALGYNAITLTAALAGFLTPVIAAAIMAASSLIVVVNSARVGRFAPAPAVDADRTATLSQPIEVSAESGD